MALHSFNGTAISLQDLLKLRNKAWQAEAIHLQKKLSKSGQRLTTIRGRGIEFDTTREYQAGDDIRSMAWRMTARSLKPHIKVYCEEKERPVWLAVDLSPSLYFGTRCMFKSVLSLTQATLTGWKALLKRERVGAILGTEQKAAVFPPNADEKQFLAILDTFAKASQLTSHFDEQNYLHALLLSLQHKARAGDLIHLYSDFHLLTAEMEKIIILLATRTHLILHFIYDPLEASPPPPNQYFITNGKQKVSFDMQSEKNRRAYQELFQEKVERLTLLAHQYRVTLQMHCTDSTRAVAI